MLVMFASALPVGNKDVQTADVSVCGSRCTGFFADTEGRGSCSMTKFVDAD